MLRRGLGLAAIALSGAMLVPWACGGDAEEEPATSSTTTGAGGCSGDCGGAGGEGSGGDAPVCGDGICGAGEMCACEADCGACCGDGTCTDQELCGTCDDDCGACTGPAIEVTRGPYLQNGSSEAVTVRWRTSEASDGVVAYGFSPDALTFLALETEAGTEHEVRLTGLLPNTKYYYAFGAPESELVGGDEDHHVVTAPTTGTDKPTRIWALGDSGTANQDAADVRDAYLAFAAKKPADLWLMLGDNAYSDGTDAEYQEAVFDMYPTVLRSTVLWSTLGNHDGHTASSTTQSGPYYDIFTFPVAGEAGGTASGTEAYYSFDYGQIHFVCLDSYDSDTDPGGDMLSWLENDLAANQLPWLIAFWHHPPYTKGSHDSDSEGGLIDMRENALPILESYGVHLVLTGHSHSYERSFFLNGHYGDSSTLDSDMLIDSGSGRADGDGAYVREQGKSEGAVYVVAGSSGKISGGSLDHPAMFVSLNELGSVILDVASTTMDLTFLDDQGQTLDWMTIEKP